MSAHRIIVVGAGVAGARAAEAIRERFDGEVLVVGADTEAPYHRPIVSKEVLRRQELSPEQTWIATKQDWASKGITSRTGVSATALSVHTRELHLDTGERLVFDRLVIATGSRPRALEVPGADGAFTLRSLADGRALAARLEPGKRLVVLGAGILGLEVAGVARALGLEVTIVERGAGVLRRAVGPLVSGRITDWLLGEGAALRTSQRVARVTRSGVALESGEVLAADVVVAAIGAEPATRWLEGSGLVLHGGAVRVDARGESSVPGIFAAGEAAAAWVARLEKYVRVEHYGWAWQHGALVGRNATGAGETFDAVPGGGTEVWGRRLQFAGDPGEAETGHFQGDVRGGHFTAVLAKQGRVIGLVGLGAPREFARLKATLGTGPEEALSAP